MELLKDLYEDFGAIGCSVFIIGALAIYCLMYFGIGYCVLSLLSVFNPIEITFEKSAALCYNEIV